MCLSGFIAYIGVKLLKKIKTYYHKLKKEKNNTEDSNACSLLKRERFFSFSEITFLILIRDAYCGVMGNGMRNWSLNSSQVH